MSDDFRPREHDHLVEPMFGGLGVGERREVERVSAWRRLWRALLRFLRRARPERGP